MYNKNFRNIHLSSIVNILCKNLFNFKKKNGKKLIVNKSTQTTIEP